MSILKYGWTIIINIISIFIIILLLGKADTNFEKIVISFLILIYVTITSSLASNSFAKLKIVESFSREFKQIRLLLNDVESEYDKEQEAEMAERIKENENIFWINAIFNFIMYLIIVVNLLSAL